MAYKHIPCLTYLVLIAAFLLSVTSCSKRGIHPHPELATADSLMTQGAAQSARGDIEAAMRSYKQAEPIIERYGDWDKLGILNMEIGNLYRYNHIDDKEASARYTKALECFGKSGSDEKAMQVHYLSAAAMIPDSPSAALPHIKAGMEIAMKTGNRNWELSFSSQQVSVQYFQDDFAETIRTAHRIFSEYGSSPQQPSETKPYNFIYTKCAESFIELNEPDSAYLYTEMLTLNDIADTMFHYALLRDISACKNDIEQTRRYDDIYSRIMDSLMASGSIAVNNPYIKNNLQKTEYEYDRRVLSEKLEAKRKKSSIFGLAAALTALILSAVVLILRAKVKHQRLRNSEALSRINALKEELSKRTDQDSELQALSSMLEKQLSVNQELLSWSEDLIALTEEVAQAYYIHETNPARLETKIKEILSRISDKGTLKRAEKMLDSAYPGFMEDFITEFPWLKDEHKSILILMSCGFSNNAISVILNTDLKKLNLKKTRLARKMNVETRLSTYLRKRILDYSNTIC